jgi:hypothetical protein
MTRAAGPPLIGSSGKPVPNKIPAPPEPALPAGQQPARGALATGARRATPRVGSVSGKDCRPPGSTTGTDPGTWQDRSVAGAQPCLR